MGPSRGLGLADQGHAIDMLKSTDIPPAICLPGDDWQAAGPWWVGHTRARFEKAFAWDLLRKQIPYFLPLATRTTVSSGKRRKSLVPLFPGYVFFAGGETHRYAALTTGRLSTVIPAKDQQQLVSELQSLRRTLESGALLETYAFAAVGRAVRVARGPLRGIEGTIVQDGDLTRLVLRVSLIGQGALLEIAADLLEPAD